MVNWADEKKRSGRFEPRLKTAVSNSSMRTAAGPGCGCGSGNRRKDNCDSKLSHAHRSCPGCDPMCGVRPETLQRRHRRLVRALKIMASAVLRSDCSVPNGRRHPRLGRDARKQPALIHKCAPHASLRRFVIQNWITNILVMARTALGKCLHNGDPPPRRRAVLNEFYRVVFRNKEYHSSSCRQIWIPGSGTSRKATALSLR